MMRFHQDVQGVSLIELLVAIVVFALLFLMVDGVFIVAHRSARKAEVGADVQQNARIAVERLTREIREASTSASPAAIVIGPGGQSVAFKSARPSEDPSAFCLNVSTSDTLYSALNTAGCFSSPGPSAAPTGTYLPVWQRYVGYYLNSATGELHRYVGNLSTSSDALSANPSVPPVGASDQVIATFVQSITVGLSGRDFTVALQGRGTVIVQGSTVPPQEILLNSKVSIRN